MLLEKAHYIKYKSQVIIVRFDEETGEFRVRRESKVVAGPKRVCVPSVRVKRIFNQSAMSRGERPLPSQHLTPRHRYPCRLSIGKLLLEVGYIAIHTQGVSYILNIF